MNGMWICPVNGAVVEGYEIEYVYAPCPGNCGNDVHTSCRDRMTLAPCGHVVVGQDAIQAVEHTWVVLDPKGSNLPGSRGHNPPRGDPVTSQQLRAGRGQQ